MSNIPKLRFKEFSGEWKTSKIGNLGTFQGGGTPTTSEEKYWTGNIPWISSSDIIEGDIKNINISRFINDTSIKESATKLIPKGSILFVSRVGVGKLAIASSDLCTSQDFTNLTLKDDSSYFIASYFLSKSTLLERYSQGTSIKGFTTGDLKTLKLNLPCLNEQQKIASFLSAVDTKIDQLTHKKGLLEQYKKGVMQKIFSQGLRFKADDGSEFPEWEEKKLGEIGEFRGGGTPSKNTDEYWMGTIPWISSSDILDDNIHDINISRFINEKAIKESATKIIPSNSVLFVSRVGVGKVAINKVDLCTSQDFTNFIPDDCLSYFLGYFFLANKNVLRGFNQGTSIKGFTKSDLETLVVNFPCFEEQTKIANFLSALDTKIDFVAKQLDGAKNFKKGLLQQMFV